MKYIKKLISNKRYLYTGLAFLLVLSFIICQRFLAISKNIPKVKTVPVRRGALITSISTNGVIIPEEQEFVTSKVVGVIKEVYVNDGEDVEEACLLIELDDESIKMQIKQAETALKTAEASYSKLKNGPNASAKEQAKANLSQAKIGLKEAERNLKSLKMLYNAKAVSKEQIDLAKGQLERAKIACSSAKTQLNLARDSVTREDKEVAELQIEQAEKAKELAEEQLEEIKIYAPISGKVSFSTSAISAITSSSSSSSSLQEGQPVTPGIPLLTITNMEKLQVKAYVDEINIKEVYVGQICEVTGDAIQGKTLPGRIAKISSNTVIQEGITAVEVIITLDNIDKGLKVGNTVDVEIITNYKTNAHLIPNQAVINQGEDKYVYVVKKQSPPRAEQRKIETGLSSETDTEILSGISENEEVILTGIEKLKNGIRVKIE